MPIDDTAPAENTASRLAVIMFTDLVGSTQVKTTLTTAGYLPLLKRHDELLRRAVGSIKGSRFQQDTGDGCYAVFATPSDAIRASLRFQRLMHLEPWPQEQKLTSRIGIHLGEVAETDVQQDGGNKLVGLPIDLAARIMSLAGGGQILMTRAAFDDARQFLVSHPDDTLMPLKWLAHGPYLFKGSDEPHDVFEVGCAGMSPLVAPPDSDKARRALRPGDETTLGWRPAIGLTLPNAPTWMIEKKLGEGGFGEIWLAGHSKIKDRVRVFKFCFDADRLRALKREVVLFRLLKEALGDRRDISRVLDWKLDEAPYYIEMEYTPAGNLSDWAAAQGGIEAVPLERRLKIIADVAEALSAAHSVGILHKDIKPSNVLMVKALEGDDYPRLTDFGIGVLTDRNRLKDFNITAAGFTASNITMNDSSRTGTRMYAPPEAQLDRPHTVQGDVYALGVMLYQMAIADLTRPLAQGWEKHVSDPLLREDIAACVAGEPKERLSSAAEVRDRLRGLESRRADRKAEEERVARQEQLRNVARRRKVLLRFATAGMTVLAVLVGTAIWASLRVTKERDTALAAEREKETQRAAAELDRKETYFNKITLADNARRDGDYVLANKYLAECPADLCKWEWGYLKYACRDPHETLPAPENLKSMAFSPTDELLALVHGDKIELWDVTEAPYTPVRTLEQSEEISAIAFSPDGRQLSAAGPSGKLEIWDAYAGQRLRTIDLGVQSVAQVIYFRDGASVLVRAEGDAKLYRVDTQVGARLQGYADGASPMLSMTLSDDGKTVAGGSKDRRVRFWGADSALVERVMPKLPNTYKAEAVALFFAGGDTMLVHVNNHRNVYGIEVTTARIAWQLHVGGDNVRQLEAAAFGGSTLMVADGSKTQVVNAATGQRIRLLQGTDRSAHARMAVSRSGLAAVRFGNGPIDVWRAALTPAAEVLDRRAAFAIAVEPRTGAIAYGAASQQVDILHRDGTRRLIKPPAYPRETWALSWLNHGASLAYVGDDGVVGVLDTETGLERHRFQFAPGKLSSVATALSDTVLIAANETGAVSAWSLKDGKTLWSQPPSNSRVSVVVGPDDSTVLVADRLSGVRNGVWNGVRLRRAADGVEIGKIPDNAHVYRLAFDQSGSRAFGVDVNGRTLRAMSWPDASVLWEAVSTSSSVYTQFGSPLGSRIASAHSDGRIRVWDAETGRQVLELDGTSGDLFAFSWTAAGNALVVGGLGTAKNGLIIYRGTSNSKSTPRAIGRQERGQAAALAISRDGSTAWTSGWGDPGLYQWNTETGGETNRFPGRNAYSLVLSTDEKKILAAAGNLVQLWDTATGELLISCKGHENWVLSVCFLPGEQFSLSTSDDGTLRRWDLKTGKEVQRIDAHPGYGAIGLACSPDGKTAWTGGKDDRVARLWDLKTGTKLQEVKTGSWVRTILFSPDGGTVCIVDDGAGASIRDRLTGGVVKNIAGSFPAAAYSPDGRYLVFGSTTGEIVIVDAREFLEVDRVKLADGDIDPWIWRVAFRDNLRFLAAGRSGTVTEWTIKPAEIGGLTDYRSITTDSWMTQARRKVVSAGQTENLIPLIHTAGAAPANVVISAGMLEVVSPADQRTRVSVPVRLRGDYEVSAEFTRTSGNARTAFILPLPGGRQVSVDLDTERGVSGPAMIKGRSPGDQAYEGPKVGRVLTTGKRHRIQLRVEILERDSVGQVRLSCKLDGIDLWTWSGATADLSLHDSWTLPDPRWIGMGSGIGTTNQFHKLELRMLTGYGNLYPGGVSLTPQTQPATQPATGK